MDIAQAIETRRSIRKYRPDAIEPDKLTKIAEAFRLAPSARNGQDWKLYFVTKPEVKEKIREASPSKHSMITEAPVVLVGTCSSQRIMSNSHRVDTTDVSIAMTFAMLQAHALGLGTCWMANYLEPEVRSALELPEDISIVAIMPLGYANEDPEARPRKPLDEVVGYI